MVRPKQSGLTDNEYKVMRVLWKSSPLKVQEILERIDKKPKPAYTSLMTLVKTMTDKGYLSAKKEGKAFFYSPVLKETNLFKSELGRLKERFFGGSTSNLIVNLIKKEDLSEEEISELREILNSKEI
jgi:predicted transcriptional regulator